MNMTPLPFPDFPSADYDRWKTNDPEDDAQFLRSLHTDEPHVNELEQEE